MNKARRISVGDFKIGKEEKLAVLEVLDSNRITEDKKVWEFELDFAKYIGTRYCIALSSGTAAIIAALRALGYDERFPKVKTASKAITSPVTYTATSNAIILSGMEPVYVDIDPQTFTLLPAQIEDLLKKDDPDNYSIILPVHLMGYPNDMEAINQIARKYNLVTFEDSAQAHGSIYKGKKVGSLSLLSAFSFYSAHNIQAGEMGAVSTNDIKLAKLIRQIKANGRICDCEICQLPKGKCPKMKNLSKQSEDIHPRFTHTLIGYNFKLMEFQAALGLCQLKKVNWIFQRRQANVRYLNKHLQKYSDLLQLPVYTKDISYLAYPIIIKDPEAISRKTIRRKLEEKGIETRPLFGCIPTQQPAYSYLKEKYMGKLPNAENVGKNGFYIGCHQYLEQNDLDYILKVFSKILNI